MPLKLVFILSVSMIVLANADIDEGLKEFFESCIAESGTTKAEALKLKEHDFSNNDPKVKCFAKCFCQKIKKCDEKNNLIFDRLDDIPADFKAKIEAAAKKCSTTTGVDDCDTVYQRVKCFHANTNF